jgi:hypothetical protein
LDKHPHFLSKFQRNHDDGMNFQAVSGFYSRKSLERPRCSHLSMRILSLFHLLTFQDWGCRLSCDLDQQTVVNWLVSVMIRIGEETLNRRIFTLFHESFID